MGGEEMAHDLVVGDNIVVMCQTSTNERFWIMLVDQLMHMVIEHFVTPRVKNGLKGIMSYVGYGMRGYA